MTQTMTAGFLISSGFPMACLTSMIEPLRAANEIHGTDVFRWRLLSEGGGQVMSSAQIGFETDPLRGEDPVFDYLILLSAPTARLATPATAGILRRQARHGAVLGAVSGGVFPLVRAGLAPDTPVAVHWCYRAAFETAFPDQAATDQVLEWRGKTITAAGAAAAFDLALLMIEQRLGRALATEVACWFQHPVMRRGDVAQAIPALLSEAPGAELPPLVAQAVRLFSETLSEPPGVAEVAARLEISPRQLERAFKQATGLSPSRYARKLRMEAARQIVLYTNDRLAEIAQAVGYGDAQTFGKHYRAAFGKSPLEDRAQINLFRVTGNLPVPST
ncbi:GlxA family transcriptional regulator [Dinoroseobacter sp. S124A]|uniref:GlxA family transcriptional regulator n=1 Tax=Dinoroseobacter sp. S124A TaxID=3415128 RepID=UPI003C7A564E